MDVSGLSSEAVAGAAEGEPSRVGSPPRQGAFGDRQVSVQQGQSQGLSTDGDGRALGGTGMPREAGVTGTGRALTTPAVPEPAEQAAASRQRSPVEEMSFRQVQPVENQVSPHSPVAQGSPVTQGSPVAHGSDARPQQEDAAHDRGLPWLNAQENAQRRTIRGRLLQLGNRHDVPAEVMDGLLQEFEYLSFDERFVLHAHQLLHRSRRELLGEVDWGMLCALVWQMRSQFSEASALLRDRLTELARGGAMTAEVEALAGELQLRLDRVVSHLHSKVLGWDDVVRLVRVDLPIPSPNRTSLTTNVRVQSRVVPGTALGSCFVQGYPSEDSIGRYSTARYRHVPKLAQTILTNEPGQTLFSGLRHGIVGASELDGDLLRRLDDEELQSLLGEFGIGEEGPDAAGQVHGRQVSVRCDAIRNNSFRAASDAHTIRQAVCMRMARESAAAALIADDGMLGRAMAGETVDVCLFSISLLLQEDYANWSQQQQAFAELDQQGAMELQVRDPDETNALHAVVANVRIRQFVLSPGEEVLNAWTRQVGTDAVERLLGPRHEPGLNGDIFAGLCAMNARVSSLSNLTGTLEQQFARIARSDGGAVSEEAADLGIRILESRKRRALLTKKIRALRTVGEQLKSMWVRERGLPNGRELHRLAAARLALIGHLMGEMPVLICMSGRDFARQLDAEIKFLATVADRMEGGLPPVEQQLDTWGPAREAFTPQ